MKDWASPFLDSGTEGIGDGRAPDLAFLLLGPVRAPDLTLRKAA
jgi:hypothetical protein